VSGVGYGRIRGPFAVYAPSAILKPKNRKGPRAQIVTSSGC
jgi:hypothetical protein